MEVFYVTEIAHIEQDFLEAAEIELIDKLDSYRRGYNDTLGGDGRRYLNIDDYIIINTYSELNNLTKVSDKLKISRDTIRKVLNNYNIDTSLQGNEHYKQIKIVSLDLIFDSITSCAQYLIDNNYTNTSLKSVAGSIGRAASKQRKSYLKLVFEFI